jgi:oligosaccharide repeat unit polymerase
MNNLDFALHFAEHGEVGLLFIVGSLTLNLLIMRRYIYSIFDPLLFYTVLSAMAGSVVPYLYWFDLISAFYFWSYVLTQAAFLGGFLLTRPPVRRDERTIRRPRRLYSGPIRVLYPLAVALFASSQLAVYAITGPPILLESRLEAFAGGTGYGLLSRVIFVTSTIALAIAFYRLLLLRMGRLSRFTDAGVVAFCVVVAILSGSKGALLSLIFTVSLALYFARRFYPVAAIEQKVRKVFIVTALLAIPVAMAATYLQSGIEQPGDLVSVLLMRFLQSGDIFFMVYPNDVLSHLSTGNGWLALFYAPLGSLRLVGREDLPVNLGLQAFWYHYDTDLLSGPNARHNVFGLHYFGPFLSIAFSFALGSLFGFARNTLYRRLPATAMGMVVYVLLFGCAVFIEQDVSGQALEYLSSVVLVFPLLYLASGLIEPGPVRGTAPPRRPAVLPSSG